MKKLLFYLTTICLSTFLVACDPTPEPTPVPEPTPEVPEEEGGNEETVDSLYLHLAEFVGEYNLNIDVNGYYVDDEPSDSQSEYFQGDLRIAFPEGIEKPHYVEVFGTFDFGGEQRLVYETTGTLDANGNLKLENNIYQASVPITISYSPIKLQEPLTWNSTMTCTLYNYAIRYELSNVATKTSKR